MAVDEPSDAKVSAAGQYVKKTDLILAYVVDAVFWLSRGESEAASKSAAQARRRMLELIDLGEG